jgi:hypothetical protein
MTAVSISFTRGTPGQFWLPGGTTTGGGGGPTVGTNAPTATFDFEVRYNLLDQNSNPISRLDLQLFLRAVEALLTEQGLQQPAGTYTLPGLGI